jgi:hypothetical protein
VTNLAKRTNTKRGRIKGQPYKFLHGHGRFLDYAKRFWARVNKHGPVHPVLKTRCWLWTGCTDSYGYGRATMGKVTTTTQRIAWFLLHGNWPKANGCHHCDNPPCVRPEHIFDGDHAANSADMVAKGRTKHGATWYVAHNMIKEKACLKTR